MRNPGSGAEGSAPEFSATHCAENNLSAQWVRFDIKEGL